MNDARLSGYPISYLPCDLIAGLVVFLVALLCAWGLVICSACLSPVERDE